MCRSHRHDEPSRCVWWCSVELSLCAQLSCAGGSFGWKASASRPVWHSKRCWSRSCWDSSAGAVLHAARQLLMHKNGSALAGKPWDSNDKHFALQFFLYCGMDVRGEPQRCLWKNHGASLLAVYIVDTASDMILCDLLSRNYFKTYQRFIQIVTLHHSRKNEDNTVKGAKTMMLGTLTFDNETMSSHW